MDAGTEAHHFQPLSVLSLCFQCQCKSLSVCTYPLSSIPSPPLLAPNWAPGHWPSLRPLPSVRIGFGGAELEVGCPGVPGHPCGWASRTAGGTPFHTAFGCGPSAAEGGVGHRLLFNSEVPPGEGEGWVTPTQPGVESPGGTPQNQAVKRLSH